MFEIKGFTGFNENWLEGALDEWALFVQKDLRRYWERERDPNTGTRWAPLTPRYKAWKIGAVGNLPKLVLSGELLGTAKVVRRGKMIQVDIAEHGFYHQSGTSRMKARPFLGISDTAVKAMADISLSNILKQTDAKTQKST